MSEHGIVINDRKSVVATGIASVENYDDKSISATINDNTLLVIEGQELKLSDLNLEKGELRAEGTIGAVYYDEKTAKTKRFFGFAGR